LIVPTVLHDDYVVMGDLRQSLSSVEPSSVLCVFTTTSCFAPRQADPVVEVARLCQELDIPHVINNAYGLQCSKLTHIVSQAAREGRVDAVVQSCDKNFCVPVGGAVVASNNKAFIKLVSDSYPGRASASVALDVMITLLGLGEPGWRQLLSSRKALAVVFEEKLRQLAEKHGERVIKVPKNTISFGLTLTCLGDSATQLGAHLYTRRVSGGRVTVPSPSRQVFGFSFACYGSSTEEYPVPYIAVACALGLSLDEVDLFIDRLDKALTALRRS
jgi:O-phospho-L-seryl-tRNASec:L-selenocysteinyl-tRNA synthase